MSRQVAIGCGVSIVLIGLAACTPATSGPGGPSPTASSVEPSTTSSTSPSNSTSPTSPGSSSPSSPGSSSPSSSSSQSTPRPTPRGDGLRQPWTFEAADGGRGTFTVPSESTGLIRRIEKERKRNKGDKLYYVVVDVDNRSGSAKLNLTSLSLRDRKGDKLDSTSEQSVIERWHLPSGHAARDRLIKLQTDMTPTVAAGRQRTVVKVFRKPITSISRTFVYLQEGLETAEAYPG